VDGTRFERGYQNTTGALHGARGAQFIGKLIHPPHQNQHESQLARFSAIVESSFSVVGSNPILRLFPSPFVFTRTTGVLGDADSFLL